eukprot:190507_1
MSLSSSQLNGEHQRAPVSVHPIQVIQDSDDGLDEFDEILELKVYFKDELMPLNIIQMRQIMEIIKFNAVYNQSPHKITRRNTDGNNEDGVRFEYILDIVDHKLAWILIVIQGMVMFPLVFIYSGDSMIYNLYSIATGLPAMAWLILQHLLLNKTALKLCLHTFDYWFKFVYVLIFCVADLLHNTPLVNGINRFTLTNIKECFNFPMILLEISFISSFDACHFTKTKKLVPTILFALLTSLTSIYYQFFCPSEEDYKIILQFSHGVISMQNLLASSSRILAIFIWKQAVNTYKSKETTITISKSAKITWIDSSSLQPNLVDINNGSKCTTISTQNIPKMELQQSFHQLNNRRGNRQESMSSVINNNES